MLTEEILIEKVSPSLFQIPQRGLCGVPFVLKTIAQSLRSPLPMPMEKRAFG
jgi:hypothetical protein